MGFTSENDDRDYTIGMKNMNTVIYNDVNTGRDVVVNENIHNMLYLRDLEIKYLNGLVSERELQIKGLETRIDGLKLDSEADKELIRKLQGEIIRLQETLYKDVKLEEELPDPDYGSSYDDFPDSHLEDRYEYKNDPCGYE